MRRVVVTGMGIVSSIGNDVGDVLESLRLARPGSSFAPEYAELGVRCQVHGAPRLDPFEVLDRRTTRFMGKGAAWINGNALGRYWSIVSNGTCGACDYRGAYEPSNCRTGCGEPSQSLYHVPVAWLEETENTVILLEETAQGDAEAVKLVQVHRA